MRKTFAIAIVSSIVCGGALRSAPPDNVANLTLTAVDGIKVGHQTLTERPTGCTVVLADGDGAVESGAVIVVTGERKHCSLLRRAEHDRRARA